MLKYENPVVQIFWSSKDVHVFVYIYFYRDSWPQNPEIQIDPETFTHVDFEITLDWEIWVIDLPSYTLVTFFNL